MKTIKVYREQELLWKEASLVQYPWEGMKGLLGRTEMNPQQLMIFPHTNSIHTFFMKMILDVVFLDKHRIVQRIVNSLQPGKICSFRKAYYTLEMKERISVLHCLKPGQKLWWEEDGQVSLEFVLIIAVFILAMVVAIPHLISVFQLFAARFLFYMADI